MSEDLIIPARKKDLGGFTVTRSIPSAQKRFVGPFVFLDHMGPFVVSENAAMDVRPHPHIGLATVTYLFSGRGYHRDSLGNRQVISPGDLNWMTAGKGIAHSERTPDEDRKAHLNMHGVQIWVALPASEEECDPTFAHWSESKLPGAFGVQDLKIKVLLGEYAGVKSPVKIMSPTLFLDLQSQKAGSFHLKFSEKEIGFFLVQGSAVINGQKLELDDLFIPGNPTSVVLELSADARLVVIGGEPFPEPRYIWWNFVSSRKERIHQAAKDWADRKFGQVPDETDWIPLPKDPLP